jgi:endonuclease YncB( thermonuclease family)
LIIARPLKQSCKAIPDREKGRRQGFLRCGKDDLAAIMVRSGWAVDWPSYSRGAYADMQDAARRENRGLWAGFFAVPWEWRKGAR